MKKRRQATIKTQFWTSQETEKLTSMDKFFYLYMISNPHSNLCGCYEISLRMVAFEIGLPLDVVKSELARMRDLAIMDYDFTTGEVLIGGVLRNNYSGSSSQDEFVLREIRSVKNHCFRLYLRAEQLRMKAMIAVLRKTGVKARCRKLPFFL